MPQVSSPAESIDSAKAELRPIMRALRRQLDDRSARSEAIWRHVVELPAMFDADRVLAFTTLPGEPETEALRAWCAATGRLVATPEAAVDSSWPDAVIVPGLAFTAAGERLGQGGGWYDRFLAHVRDDCATVGVCFTDQVLDSVPTDAHDVRVDHVVTDAGVLR